MLLDRDLVSSVSKVGGIPMESSLTVGHRFGRRPLTALARLTGTMLVGLALLLTYLQAMLIGQLIPPLAVFAVLSLVIAGIVFTGWRWTPLVGAAWCLFIIVGNSDNIVYNLAHPADL